MTAKAHGLSAVDVEVGAGTFGAISAIKMSMDLTQASSGNVYTGLDISVDGQGATGGDFHALDVRFAGSDWSDTLEVEAVATGIGVDPIKQYLGEIVCGC